MKKSFFLVFIAAVVNLQNVFAEVPPTKIVTGHADFSIKITRCVAEGSTVLIDMVLLNKSERDIEATLANDNIINTIVYDSEGNVYQEGPWEQNATINIRVANKTFAKGIEHAFISGIPVKAQLKITGVSTDAEYFARIDFPLTCYALGLDYGHKAILRNIPITRE